MKKFFTWITKHSKTVIVIYVLLVVVSLLVKPMIKVNYSMVDYLPQDTPSTIAIKTMSEEFSGGTPNCRVLIKGAEVSEVLDIKERLLDCDLVESVSWLDDSADVLQSLSYIDQDLIDTYYKDGNALLIITADDEQSVTALEQIKSVVGEDALLTGDLVSIALATTSTAREVSLVAIIGILFAMCVLCFMTKSWVEPPMVIIGLGVAVALNTGTNLIFGEVSFVTDSCGNILQMAVSLDYTVFLIHRFEEAKKTEPDLKKAMVDALCGSVSSIASSGLTTVIGFIALIFMEYKLGADLGMALAKGIAISLLVVFTFTPALILVCQPIIQKTSHKEFLPSFGKLADFVLKFILPGIIIFAIVLVPSFLASNSNDFYYGAAVIFGPGTEYGDDTKEISDLYGYSDTYVLMVPNDGNTYQQNCLSESLKELDNIESIISYVDSVGMTIPYGYIDDSLLSQIQSEDYTRFIITASVDFEGEETFNLVEKIRTVAEYYYPGEWHLAGNGVSTYDLMDTISSDILKVNLIAIGAIFVILLAMMKSLSLPIVLILTIESAVWINTGIPYFTGNTVFYFAYLIISSIQLGATVDYAILFTDRYMEYRHSLSKKQAARRMIRVCTPSILASGLVLMVMGFLMYFVSSHGIISQLGLFLGRGAILSLIAVIFVLPGLLIYLDPVIRKSTKNADWI